jgi:ABC-2 type transport system permease protein
VTRVLAIAGVELRRFLKDRSNIFFVFIFPLLLVVVIGAQFGGGGSTGRVAVAAEDSTLRTAVVEVLEDDGLTVTFADADGVREQVARGRTDAGVFIDAAAATAYTAGEGVRLEVVPSSQSQSQATVQRIRTAAEAVRVEQAQVVVLTERGVTADDAQAALEAARESVTGPTLRVESVNEIQQEFSGLGQFDLGASSQLLLFVFLSSLAGSVTLIQARRQGVIARTLAAPVSTAQALGGQALGRFVIALFQGAYIMGATALLFGVDWGNIWLSLTVLTVFSTVAAGAAMLVGALMDNEGAASGVGIGAGLVLAALGGCMMPLEFFPDTMRTIANITPHAWAYEAFAEIQRQEGTLADILPQLGVLLGMALVLLALGTWALRRSLVRSM